MKLRLLTAFLALTAILLPLRGQEARYMWELGGGIGMSGYNGDANHGFPFRHPGFAAHLTGRYNFDTRWALRINTGIATIKGNTADMDNYLPGGADYRFSSTVYDLALRGEFNFFPYGIGETYKRLRRWTPFVSAGAGALLSKVGSDTYAAMEIPLGLGVKFKPSERLNLAVELTMAKALGDKVDGKQLSDPYTIKSSFLKNTDWYSTLTVSLTYEFGERCTACNRKD